MKNREKDYQKKLNIIIILMIILILVSLLFITQSIVDNTNEIIEIKEQFLKNQQIQ